MASYTWPSAAIQQLFACLCNAKRSGAMLGSSSSSLAPSPRLLTPAVPQSPACSDPSRWAGSGSARRSHRTRLSKGMAAPIPRASPALPARVCADSRGCALRQSARRPSDSHTCVCTFSSRSQAATLAAAAATTPTPLSIRRFRRPPRNGHGASVAHCWQGMTSLAQSPSAERSLLCGAPAAGSLTTAPGTRSGQGSESANGSHLKPNLPALRHQRMLGTRPPREGGLEARVRRPQRQSARVSLHAHLLLESQAPSESTTARCRTSSSRSLCAAIACASESIRRRFVARCGHFLMTSLIKGISKIRPKAKA